VKERYLLVLVRGIG